MKTLLIHLALCALLQQSEVIVGRRRARATAPTPTNTIIILGGQGTLVLGPSGPFVLL